MHCFRGMSFLIKTRGLLSSFPLTESLACFKPKTFLNACWSQWQSNQSKWYIFWRFCLFTCLLQCVYYIWLSNGSCVILILTCFHTCGHGKTNGENTHFLLIHTFPTLLASRWPMTLHHTS